MDVVVIGASNDDSIDVGIGKVLGGVDIFELGQHLENGFPVGVVAGFEVGPCVVIVIHIVDYNKQVYYYFNIEYPYLPKFPEQINLKLKILQMGEKLWLSPY